MGVEWHLAKFLVTSARAGVRFDRTLTLGRQNLHVAPSEILSLYDRFGSPPPGVERTLAGTSEYADRFLVSLGARDLVTMDASNYEGASLVHDLNTPVSRDLHEQFDVVIDGGTLEHVFNFPVGIANAMQMVRLGGHLIIQTPANSFLGHGFYQFSPELFYRVLSEQNGFEVKRMIAAEWFPKSQWYEVADPAKISARVELVPSDHRILLLVCAQRTAVRPIFQKTPQQSDYQATWDKTGSPQPAATASSADAVPARPGGLKVTLDRMIPGVMMWLRARQDAKIQSRYGLRAQPSVFKPVDQ